MERRWVPVPESPAAGTLRAAGLPAPEAELLAQRGITLPDDAERFLSPSLDQLSDLRLLTGFTAAVERLGRAAEQETPMVIVGDYDVDGVTATALMAATVTALGGRAETLLPRRDGEGYGLQPLHVRRAVASGASLLLVVDSGSTAREAWAEAEQAGIELVVVDHHLAEGRGDEAGVAPLLVNPRRGAAPVGARDLTAAGLAVRLAVALFERGGREAPWDALLRLGCLGTIADVAPLVGDNRIIAALGLAAMTDTPSPGLRALMRAAAVRGPLSAADVAFRLAPRLNAAGRLASADEALELFLTRDHRRANELAALLEQRNAERQAIEARILTQARELLWRRAALPPVVVLASEEWHAGVVGVAAARLARDLHRPTILLASRDGLATGSGRSVAGLPLHELVAPFAGRLERFGGHAQAIGLTVREERVEALRADLERAAEGWSERLAVPEIGYDLSLDLDRVDRPLVDSLARLGPFGAGNPEPVFRFGPCHASAPVEAFGNGHLRFEVSAQDARTCRRAAVWWRGAERRDRIAEKPFELLAAIEADRYVGVRLRVVDARGVAATSD